MKRVFLTGARGFIGSNVIAPLVEHGYEVHAVGREVEAEKCTNVNWHCLDILDGRKVSNLMSEIRPTHLLHLAWYTEHGKFWNSLENFQWLEASIALMRSFYEQGGVRAIMAGSCAEYDWKYGYCTEGVTPCQPATPYGICKNVMQETLSSYCSVAGTNSAWGRVFFLYGPGEAKKRLLASVIDALLQGKTENCTHGKQIRDFLYVEDAARAFVAMLDSSVMGAVNISSGQPVSLKKFVLTAAEQLGAEERINFGALEAPLLDPPLLVGNNKRLCKETGWQPTYDLSSGIAQTIKDWRKRLGQ